MKDKDRELKPCPFCGSDLIDIQSSIQMEQTDIRCTDCDILISFKCCEEDAVQDWNKRSYKPLGKEELEGLANDIELKVMAEITDRRGFRQEWDCMDKDIQNEIEETLIDIISQAIINARGE